MRDQLTVRLSDNLDSGLSILAKRLRLRRSEIVRMTLERFLEELKGMEEDRPYYSLKFKVKS